jgi:hypothetical protein
VSHRYQRGETSEQVAARFLALRRAIPVSIETRLKIQGFAGEQGKTTDQGADELVRRMLEDEAAREVAARMFAP